MRVHTDYRSVSEVNYKLFCKEYPNISVSFNDWRNVIYSFNNAFREHILETGEKVNLPAGLGAFSIRKRKQAKVKEVNGKKVICLPVDWPKTLEKGKRIYIMNYHTEGYYFGWWWFKRSIRFKLSELWWFKPSRTSSRLLAHYLTIDNEYQHKYCEWKLIG
jgi:nucleoid DNA-binding protein